MINVLVLDKDNTMIDKNVKCIEDIPCIKNIFKLKNKVEAIDLLEREKIELLITSLDLEDGKVYDLINLIRKKRLNTDIIVVSKENNFNKIKDILRMGVIDYILKPYRDIRLNISVKNYIRKYKLINISQKIDQNSLDKILNRNSKEYMILPKGLNDKTLCKVSKKLSTYDEDEFIDCETIAKDLKISKVTIRKYLEYLEDEGVLEKKMKYGSVGRPAFLYKKIE